MSHFLTNKAKSIPKLIVINKTTSGALAHWGPRPNGAVELIEAYKKQHGVTKPQSRFTTMVSATKALQLRQRLLI
jgi:hypothetical protein